MAQDETTKSALSQGAEMLSRRALSEKELFDRLVWKGCEAGAAGAAVSRLRELKALNDGALAGDLARRYENKGYGRLKIEYELKRRGIAEDAVSGALDALSKTEENIDGFIKKRAAGASPGKAQIKSMADALLRRGFSHEEIDSAMKRHFNVLEGDAWP